MGSMLKKIKKNIKTDYVTFICPKCKTKEDIPFDVVDMLDKCDGGDPKYPPRFDCLVCNGKMQPVYYKNYKGIVYEFNEE